MHNPEYNRLQEASENNQGWKKWGPYLSERQWGTVREDYSPMGSAWDYFPHDHARSRAYRWGEDGIAGISDNKQHLCFSFAFWNGKDSILKERMFGLNAEEGNHGEDVKELYYYLDSTPTHSFMKMLYKYPISAFPYADLVHGNTSIGPDKPEFELWDTGVFENNNYFDIYLEYAKGAAEDLLIKATVINRSSAKANCSVLPTVWFRNTWAWGDAIPKPQLHLQDGRVHASHQALGDYILEADHPSEWLFTNNETNPKRLFDLPKVEGEFYKDAFHEYLIDGNAEAVNPSKTGTKAAALFALELEGGQTKTIRLRLRKAELSGGFGDFEQIWNDREHEANLFYEQQQEKIADPDLKNIQRQAYAGMLWSKQYYNFNIYRWLKGDPGHPAPPEGRSTGRNSHWQHLHHEDIISMPDKWEYPWYAAWDLAFHCIPFVRIDAAFAKEQLLLLLSERCLHPNGQLPAYEWAFSDVNPPVHAWAVLRVFNIDKKLRGGEGDLQFLEQAFHKLMLNFTWWVNQKDDGGNNIFEGGFLGLDNIGVFDRGAPLPTGSKIEQADGTSWMALYSVNMLRIAMELAKQNASYKPMITKFLEHFIYISAAMNNIANAYGLWDNEDGFYYDILHWPDGRNEKLKVRSMVGLIPLFAVETFTQELVETLPEVLESTKQFFELRPDLSTMINKHENIGQEGRRMIAVMRKGRMEKVLSRMLDETEFLSPYGIRALSKHYEKNPYRLNLNGRVHELTYLPGESNFHEFGKNSNWRGPIWFPMNYLILVSLIRYDQFYGEEFKMEYPTGSGHKLTLREIAVELGHRLINIFAKDKQGQRAVYANVPWMNERPEFRDNLLFYEYFHGDTGRGVGASHQTGWTGLIAEIIYKSCTADDHSTIM